MSKTSSDKKGPIGVFDSGFGGLTILREIRELLPQYDYLFLGDNARAPYGSRSYDMVYKFTLEAVRELFARGCPLVILACNTASAEALRTIQQNDLPEMDDPTRRVLGVIRPTAEVVGQLTKTGHIGLFATAGTVKSHSYDIEIGHLHQDIVTNSHACPMWVPLIENGEKDTEGADFFIKRDTEKLLASDPEIDTIILACTHYPIIANHIRKHLPSDVRLVSQGGIVAKSLADYLDRHPEMEERLIKRDGEGKVTYLTTENPEKFDTLATLFVGYPVESHHCHIGNKGRS